MAEFQELMRQMIRLHKSCDCGCVMADTGDQCPLYDIDDAPCEWINVTEKIPTKKIEDAVMAWAAEHPEPVYPTWAQYFNKIIISNGRKPLLTDTELLKVVCTPIPADIAQKLGIEPKEG